MDGFLSTTPDPLVPLFQEWQDVRQKWINLSLLPGNENFDDPRFKAAETRMLAVEKQMLAMTPSSLEGIAAIATLGWTFCAPITNDPEELDGGQIAMRAIWRACTGKDGDPVD